MGRMKSLRSVGRARASLLAVVLLVVLVAGGAVVAVVGRRSAGTAPKVTRTSAGSVAAERTKPPVTAVGPSPMSAEPAMGAPVTSDVSGGSAQLPAPSGPRVVRTADVTVGVAAGAFSRAFDGITAAATAEGGYVSASTTSTGSGGDERGGHARSGDLTLRVPADRFDVVRRSLAGLGTVEQEQLRGDDVTAQIVDFDARLKSLQAEEESLRTLVGRATAVGEVIQVQSQLFDVRQQVERLQAQRDQLDQQAALASIHVALHEPGTAFQPPRPTTGLAGAVERAVAGASAVVGGTIVILGWLAPLALVGLLGWAAIRVRRRGAARVQPGTSVS